MTETKKIALITGGSRGLGANIALKLAAKGVNIIFTYQTNKEAALQVVEELKQAGVHAVALQFDIVQIKKFTVFFKELEVLLQKEFGAGRFDYLINNAGVGLHATYEETTEEQFDYLLNVHFKGLYFFTQQSLAFIHDGGAIVNMSSRLAQASVAGFSAYAAMKGAVETLTRYQAKELSPRRIRVNTVAPGPIATDFGGGLVRDNPLFRANTLAATALGRIGEASDIGGVVTFLCTADASWITAQRIEASGGMNL
ncbi:NAD(P)-dependent dehydrogenase, short-chain alcohol dehydrogenase family [Pedobacter westerhofensis]|uniref:NAD(P)-dependent dehydrogenase, short-chain alcohol dehydrogenase family n=1 Tax=Pedobacter westerhofensis TaxID=425512 RepID=A0A521B522_9SPHI|nr:SDR family oxidoreductase [Pedobacter westerhofensis]SMO42187.1 NAD(P)-dependent dehydrogenase, short-chain alcohol dehydrogenase family [Pedobacter westerhofensis]